MSSAGAPKRPDTKGQAILDAFLNAGSDGATRAQVAERVGCTVQRVGEVVRAVHPEIQKHGKVYVHASNAAHAEPPVEAPATFQEATTRTGRCDHERARKAKTGSCRECGPVRP